MNYVDLSSISLDVLLRFFLSVECDTVSYIPLVFCYGGPL